MSRLSPPVLTGPLAPKPDQMAWFFLPVDARLALLSDEDCYRLEGLRCCLESGPWIEQFTAQEMRRLRWYRWLRARRPEMCRR